MTRSITLELPDTLIEHAQREAERSGHPLEAVLTDWLEQAAGQDVKTLLEGVHHIRTPLTAYSYYIATNEYRK